MEYNTCYILYLNPSLHQVFSQPAKSYASETIPCCTSSSAPTAPSASTSSGPCGSQRLGPCGSQRGGSQERYLWLKKQNPGDKEWQHQAKQQEVKNPGAVQGGALGRVKVLHASARPPGQRGGWAVNLVSNSM